MNLRTDLKVSLRREVNLSEHCAMKVGGPADFFAEPTCDDELREVLDFSRQESLPFILIGKGSNVLFPDEGFEGLVVSMMRYEKDRIFFDEEKREVSVSSSVSLNRLAAECRERGLAGAEFLANIPGTIGGALVMNAGYSRYPRQNNGIGDITLEVRAMDDNGQEKVFVRDELQFSYRKSNLHGWIILSAHFGLWRRRKDDIAREMKANLDHRNLIQDFTYPSCGSFFRNPQGGYPTAGELIEKAGLKGLRVGDAMVSQRHANFIINMGSAKRVEILELMKKIQKAVFDANEIMLEPEVRIITKP